MATSGPRLGRPLTPRASPDRPRLNPTCAAVRGGPPIDQQLNRVLVTGFPRSGTTFVGRILAAPSSVAYLHEPLNPQGGLPAAKHRFVDLAAPEQAELAQEMEELLQLRGRLRGAVWPTDGPVTRLVKRVVPGRGPANLLRARLPPRPRHVVSKDPFALLSMPWFADHGCSNIMLVRHPAAVVASFRRLGWGRGGKRMQLLTHGPLDEQELRWSEELTSDLERVSLMWRMLHRWALAGLGQGQVVVHEHLSADPVATFERLRAEVGLPTTRRADDKLRRLTSGRTAAAQHGGRAQQFRRASSDIAAATLDRLSPDERARIWEITGDVATRWYGPDGVR